MYLIMEYCNEGTLESLILNKRHEMTEEGVMKLFTQIVIALKFLQDKKIIHRDIKPKNILLHNGKVKIADFGVAKMIDKHK
jgi:serine/threonine protein kinase